MSADADTDAAAFDCDIAIVGAGPVGLALAGALARRSATAALSIVLIDARDAAAAHRDPRVLALSYGSRTLLEPLGWPAAATPIEEIHISQRGRFGRTRIDRREHDLPALGYVLRYGALTAALRAGLDRTIAAGARVRVLEHSTVRDDLQDEHGVTVRMATASMPSSAAAAAAAAAAIDATADDAASVDTAEAAPRSLRARLLIHAEGGLFDAQAAAGMHPRSRDYQQTAIVGSVRCSAALPRVAWERFTDEGPVALLPLAESGQARPAGSSDRPDVQGSEPADYALVWCQTPEQAARRMQLPDSAFLAELDTAFGARVGKFTQLAGRAMFPLGLNRRDRLVDRRAAAIGNAAQTLHPVAGQGLNLGLRDAQALAAALGQHGATPAALADYARRRQRDRAVTIGMTDLLARGFTVDLAPVAALRGLALAALDWLPGAKSLLARQMMFGQRR
ncbi:UbiH/UbiF/VisC/COQ6 family ubiquinone biosynthesis hydroxylase [Robbsia sp. Bb-Pol-6]|uniref:UbiH/UbiF/VisC/COQ6 family ubiquinone biosynthesis hydroxylase n=1 Tax=Robbsia betulipollinis TaxID=2981849 RepID=A0ABT3ZN32_9BURK|nr:UbiH/UbiF/VisC/COQ6 family ubiquinone biosynthesis hydroxylase [Robbsia betulipollinis]